MKHLKLVCLLVLLAAFSLAHASYPPPTVLTLYVATNGNDTWSGTLPAPNPTGTDGPLLTMDGARLLVQSLNKPGLTEIDIQFRAGAYPLAQTEMFGPADAGTPSTQIVYENYPGEHPVLSGGLLVRGWVNTGGNTWVASLPPTTTPFENLYYNGIRRLRPRVGGTALGQYFRTFKTVYVSSSQPGCPHQDPTTLLYECFDRFDFDPTPADNNNPYATPWSNLAPAAGNPCGQNAGNQALQGEIEVLVFEQFDTSKLRVSCVDPSIDRVYLTGPTSIPPAANSGGNGFIAGNRYIVENVANALVAPGQWYLDRRTTRNNPNWTLTYLANPGENPNTDFVIVPQTTQLIVASGLSYVTFRGLTFMHDNYQIPATGHVSLEMEPDIAAAISFQNSNHITFDFNTMREISGVALGFISCITPTNAASAPAPECIVTSASPDASHNTISNSAFFDIGITGIRIGEPWVSTNLDSNVPYSTTVVNNVVEGYGRTIPSSYGIAQGYGHDNLYTHNEVYDGYHVGISLTDVTGKAAITGIGEANNVISFNHVYNLLQGIMNDGGSIRIAAGNQLYTAPGNQILNNRIHDVTDASIMDANGYGGHGIYLDTQTGLVDVENNLVYRVSDSTVYAPGGPSMKPGNPDQANLVKNNILAYGRIGLINQASPYTTANPIPTQPSQVPQAFRVYNNILYFDRNLNSTSPFLGSAPVSVPFAIPAGCAYTPFSFVLFQEYGDNLYWRTDGQFATDPDGFNIQTTPKPGANGPCGANRLTESKFYTFYNFAGWQQTGEDRHSVVQNPYFVNPAYPADNFTIQNPSLGIAFTPFDPSQAGRLKPGTLIYAPPIPPTFVTANFSPATDY